MNIEKAIKNVMFKRTCRGAKNENIVEWLKHLLTVWKYEYRPDIVDFIEREIINRGIK